VEETKVVVMPVAIKERDREKDMAVVRGRRVRMS
jgi:hypothetical protein